MSQATIEPGGCREQATRIPGVCVLDFRLGHETLIAVEATRLWHNLTHDENLETLLSGNRVVRLTLSIIDISEVEKP